MFTDIIEGVGDYVTCWRSNAQPWDIYAFDFDITHEEVLNIVEDTNDFYKVIGNNLRVRKSWKAVEACEAGEEIR